MVAAQGWGESKWEFPFADWKGSRVWLYNNVRTVTAMAQYANTQLNKNKTNSGNKTKQKPHKQRHTQDFSFKDWKSMSKNEIGASWRLALIHVKSLGWVLRCGSKWKMWSKGAGGAGESWQMERHRRIWKQDYRHRRERKVTFHTNTESLSEPPCKVIKC